MISQKDTKHQERQTIAENWVQIQAINIVLKHNVSGHIPNSGVSQNGIKAKAKKTTTAATTVKWLIFFLTIFSLFNCTFRHRLLGGFC